MADHPKLLNRILGVFSLIVGVHSIAVLVPQIVMLVGAFASGDVEGLTFVLIFAMMGLNTAVGVLAVLVAVFLFKGNRKRAARLNLVSSTLILLSLLPVISLTGADVPALVTLIAAIVTGTIATLLDRNVIEEVRQERRTRRMDRKKRREEKARFYDENVPEGHFCNLNIFYLFWTFFFCSILGLLFETVYHAVTIGGYQDRAGLLFGPFSPIYGFGGVLMTIALNRLKNTNPVLVFVISAAIGGAFEFFTSWFLEIAFGIVAWDYTGSFLSIDGRTNGYYMFLWGILGLLWVKVLLPILLWMIRKIPFNARFGLTGICMLLMIADGIMTLQAMDCWYKREAGLEPSSGIELFYAEYFDNDYMENRFQTMKLNPESASRI